MSRYASEEKDATSPKTPAKSSPSMDPFNVMRSPRTTPHLPPSDSQPEAMFMLTEDSEQADTLAPTDEAQYLGCLVHQAKLLRRLECVDEVASYTQTFPGRGLEYQLLIEVATANGIRLRITIGVIPAATAAPNRKLCSTNRP